MSRLPLHPGACGLLALLAALLACNVPGLVPELRSAPLTPTAPPPAQATATPLAAPSPSPELFVDTGWAQIEPGLEFRQLDIPYSFGGIPATLVRIDPHYYLFRVHYDPTNPLPISAWQIRTGAPFIINGGFFMTDNTTLGMLVSDGQVYGTSFSQHGGMLSLSNGVVDLRSLAQMPYQPGEPLDQAVQGRPMLLYPGRFPAEFDLSPEPSRRTAVAMDWSGHLIFVIVDYGALSLYDLRDWLATTPDLELFSALNLDGGGSTGMALVAGGESILFDSWSEVPSVIAFYPVNPSP